MARQAEPQAKVCFREVVLPETISVQDLAGRMSERAVDVIKISDDAGHDGHGQQRGSTPTTAQLIAEDLGHTVKRISESDVEEGL